MDFGIILAIIIGIKIGLIIITLIGDKISNR